MNDQFDRNDHGSADVSETGEDVCKNCNPDKKNFKKEIFEWIETLGLAFAFVLVVFTFIFRIVTVDGKSMHYTLDHGDKLIISNMFYTPDRGDIVVLSNERTGVPIIKRVIATEGQTVDINFSTWEITVDGELLSEDYINDEDKELGLPMNVAGSTKFPFTVSEDCVFVLGDNRNHSSDSRYYGEFSRDEVMGRVLVRLLPLDDIGIIKPADDDRIAGIRANNQY